MLGMIRQIKLLAYLRLAQMLPHIRVLEQFLKEISVLLPNPHGVALDEGIAFLA